MGRAGGRLPELTDTSSGLRTDIAHKHGEPEHSQHGGGLSEEKFRALFGNVHVAYQALDGSGCLIEVNDAWLDLFGYTRREIAGRAFKDFVADLSAPDFSDPCPLFSASGNRHAVELNATRVDGSHLTVSVEPLVGRGEVDGFVCNHFILREISQQGEESDAKAGHGEERLALTGAEQALQEKIERYRLLFELAPVAIVVAVDGKLAFADARAATILGAANARELVGVPVAQFVHSEYKEQFKNRSRLLLKERKVAPLAEQTWVRLDGKTIDVEAVSVPFTYKGKPAAQTVFADITQRKRAEAQIEASLKEKEILLREIHHRVKNNLQVISSLLRFHSRHVEDRGFGEVFRDFDSRIRSMALIHEHLYGAGELSRVDFRSYLGRVARQLFHSHGDTGKVRFSITSDRISLSVDTAIPCGLILNELVSNSLRHAFPGDLAGEIRVDFRAVGNDEFVLTVSDDGIGLPRHLDPKHCESLGFQLVLALAKQLRAEVGVSREKGTELRFRFKARKEVGK